MKERLDRARSAGFKAIVSEWMPRHGENMKKKGQKWGLVYAKDQKGGDSATVLPFKVAAAVAEKASRYQE